VEPVKTPTTDSTTENVSSKRVESDIVPGPQQVAEVTINLVLRMRNSKRELNDIRFEYLPGKDSADGISSELVGAGLVDDRDMHAIAGNLLKLIEKRDQMKNITFALNSGCLPTETPDEKSLVGFAQISISSE
jgi:serine/threonine-protein kinase OSR1/STK39